MRMLNSMSSRFSRSFNYTMPEYRPSQPKGAKTRLSLALPSVAVPSRDETRLSRSTRKR